MRENKMFVLIGILVALMFVAFLVFSVASATHVTEKTCTVTGKDRTTSTNSEGVSSSDARLYTEECGTLQVGDSILSWTFSSSDTYGRIKEGEEYRFKMRGFRIPFFSMFPNVVEAEQISS